MCFQKSNHILGKKWCSVASSTTYRRKMSAKEMMWKQQDIYILHYCPLYLYTIQDPPPDYDLLPYNLSVYLSIAPQWYLWLQIFLTSIENNKCMLLQNNVFVCTCTLYEGQIAMIDQSKRKYLTYWYICIHSLSYFFFRYIKKYKNKRSLEFR